MQTKLLILRKQHKESQKDLAKLLNISEKAYGDKERGKYMFDADEMWILSRHYHKTMDDIFYLLVTKMVTKILIILLKFLINKRESPKWSPLTIFDLKF